MIKAFFYISLCITAWAFIPIATKEVLKGMNNFSMLFFSNIVSATVMFIYLLLSKGTNKLKYYSIYDYLKMSFLGFLGAFAYYVLLYKAFSLSLAQEAFIINYSWPILVVLLGIIILKENVTLKKVFSILVSFIGVVVITTKGQLFSIKFTSIEGDIMAFLGAFCFALFSVLGKKVRYDQIVAVFVYFLSAAFMCLFTYPLFEIRNLSIKVVFWLLINGIFINGISYIFWFKALKSAQTALISNLVYLTPVLSLFFISLILHESIRAYSLVGLLFILGGIAIQIYEQLLNRNVNL